MQPDPPPPDQPETHEFPSTDDPFSSSVFDWSDFLDLSIAESLGVSESEHPVDQSQLPENSASDKVARVRKRDPRLVCSNFLAGRIPCACPELDEKLEEEESGLPGRKRSRTAIGAPARCQVPDCEADITELKGYHRRHRVCLRCANATAVVLDGESKRYCQQCGKFHVLLDFDEGKRSCRRKLEKHNNRRRRKPNDPKEGAEKEPQLVIPADCVSGDDETGKDGVSVSSQIEERETLLDSDGHISVICSDLGLHDLQTDRVAPLAATVEAPMKGDKQNPQYRHSPSNYDSKSTYSSLCPSGRISFKLYDWNPAEFPRRLRHQIFQWLASMPVELEGYIRPGCTILTAFIAMPKPVWHKLLAEPALYIKQLFSSPGSMLSGRGTMHVYLDDMIFRVTRDATSVVKIKLKDQAPKLHYIYPTCFEAGRPMEFVACGSYLLQQNFRFLISLAGQYLAYKISILSYCEGGDANIANHQLLRIYVPQVNTDLVGPAFIEVENQSGLSNFIPILVGDKETCTEMNILQQEFGTDLPSKEQLSCEIFASSQTQLSEFILDVAWLLKKSIPEQPWTSTHIQRFNNLLNFLMENESYVILEKVLCSLKCSIDSNLAAGISDSEIRLLLKNIDIAQSRLGRKLVDADFLVMPSEDINIDSIGSKNDSPSLVLPTNPGVQRMLENVPVLSVPSPSLLLDEDATAPLLKREVVMNVNLPNRPRESCGPFLTTTAFTKRYLIMAIVAVATCFGICIIALHPQRVAQIATVIHRCFSSDQ